MTAARITAMLTMAIGIGAAGLLQSGNRATPSYSTPSSPLESVSVPAPLAFEKIEAARAQPPPPRDVRADIFSFVPRSTTKTYREVQARSAPPHPVLVQPPQKREPELELIGIAEDRHGEVPLRTAIITDGAELWMVRAGQAVGTRLRVTDVSTDSVTLDNMRTNSMIRLVLR